MLKRRELVGMLSHAHCRSEKVADAKIVRTEHIMQSTQNAAYHVWKCITKNFKYNVWTQSSRERNQGKVAGSGTVPRSRKVKPIKREWSEGWRFGELETRLRIMRNGEDVQRAKRDVKTRIIGAAKLQEGVDTIRCRKRREGRGGQ